MKITVTTHRMVELTTEQMKEVCKEYLQKMLGGEGWYINKDGILEHWTSWPHGSGTRTKGDTPTKAQRLAYMLLQEKEL